MRFFYCSLFKTLLCLFNIIKPYPNLVYLRYSIYLIIFLMILKSIFSCLFFLIFGSTFSQSFTMMTYNIRYDNPLDGINAWKNRKESWFAQMQVYQPDVFGLQEVLPSQLEDIQAKFTSFEVVVMGRDGINKGEACPIFYRKERFELLLQNTFWLSETPEVISKGWDAALNRICTYALLKDKTNQTVFWVFNTHLDHAGSKAKTNSIQLILNKIKALNTENYPVFLIGDFNLEPEESHLKPMYQFMEDSFFISEEKPIGPVGTFNGFNIKEDFTKRIDYVFLSKNNPFKVMQYRVIQETFEQKYPSDHFPILIKVKWNP